MAYTSLPSSPAQYLVLHSAKSSVVLEAHSDEAPLWRYWGPRLAEAAAPPSTVREQRPQPAFTLDHDPPLSLLPGLGVGWFGQSALLAHRAGRDFSCAFSQCTWQWTTPSQALRFTLIDHTAKLCVQLELSLDTHSNVLRLQTQVVNEGEQALELQWLAAGTLLLPDSSTHVRSYAGQHNNEFQLQVQPLTRSQFRRESRRGRTSHDCHPSAVVATAGATADHGLVYGAHLAWSGNHQQTIEWLHDGQYQWQMGEWLAPGEMILAAGASYRTPELVASCSSAGLNGLAANFHTELRRRLPWPGGRMAPRPVHLNTWEAVYFEHNERELMALADAAAEVGVERFVLDDGWFQGRHHDRAALGDWWADASKYPNGLGPLARHVVATGMQFGLWFEPEMVNPDSDLHRAHPDWALQIQGRPMLTSRNQLVLDISRPEVSEYLFGKMHALLSSLPIAYIKWDLNRDLAAAGDAQGHPAWHRQVPAAYALMDRLRTAHPTLEIESCSGGGGRTDFAVLSRSHRVWTSDCIDAISRIPIQRGLLQFFPPEIMGAHIGTAPSHSTGRSQSMAFHGAVALPGHLGVELDVRHLDANTRTQLKGWIAFYKQWRQRLHTGQVWLGGGEEGLAGDNVLWQVHGEKSGADFLLLAYRTAPSTQRYMRAARLPMLRADAQYRLRVVAPEGLPEKALYAGSAPFFDALRAPDGVLADGSWLMHAGLPLPRALAETAFIVHLQKVAP